MSFASFSYFVAAALAVLALSTMDGHGFAASPLPREKGHYDLDSICVASREDLFSLAHQEAVLLLVGLQDHICSTLSIDTLLNQWEWEGAAGDVIHEGERVPTFEEHKPAVDNGLPHQRHVVPPCEIATHRVADNQFLEERDAKSSNDELLGVLFYFYESFHGDGWANNFGWGNSSIPVCLWYGIGCFEGCSQSDYEGNTCPIVSIAMQGNNLFGDISVLLNLVGNLPWISSIQLDRNYLYGTLVDVPFPNLLSLVISNNYIWGAIPDFQGIPMINLIDVSENDFVGTVPNLSQTPYLLALSCGDNTLEGELPEFDGLPLLSQIFIFQTSITGNSMTHRCMIITVIIL